MHGSNKQHRRMSNSSPGLCTCVSTYAPANPVRARRPAAQWSSLVALNDRVLALPRIAAYLASPLHLPVLHPMAG